MWACVWEVSACVNHECVGVGSVCVWARAYTIVRVCGSVSSVDCYTQYLNNEIDKFVLVHLFRVEVGDQETDVIALHRCVSEGGGDSVDK